MNTFIYHMNVLKNFFMDTWKLSIILFFFSDACVLLLTLMFCLWNILEEYQPRSIMSNLKNCKRGFTHYALQIIKLNAIYNIYNLKPFAKHITCSFQYQRGKQILARKEMFQQEAYDQCHRLDWQMLFIIVTISLFTF